MENARPRTIAAILKGCQGEERSVSLADSGKVPPNSISSEALLAQS